MKKYIYIQKKNTIFIFKSILNILKIKKETTTVDTAAEMVQIGWKP